MRVRRLSLALTILSKAADTPGPVERGGYSHAGGTHDIARNCPGA